MKNLSKKKNLKYICSVISFLLVLMMISQNCANSTNRNNVSSQTPELPSKNLITFKVDYEGTKTISDILWQIRRHHYNERQSAGCYIGSYERLNFKKPDLDMEVDENDVLQVDTTLGVGVFVQAFIQFEEDDCITYKRESFQLVPFDSSKADLICQRTAVLPPGIDPVSSMDPTSSSMIEGGIGKSLYHFPTGDSVDLELSSLRNRNSQFTWSIKNIEDDIELADQTHRDITLTHTFSEKGVYDISAIEEDTNFEMSTQLLIGKCEDTDMTEEMVIDMGSTTSN